jgi:hypothetical protein
MHDHENNPITWLILGLFIGASAVVIFYACIPLVGPFLVFYQTVKEGKSHQLFFSPPDKKNPYRVTRQDPITLSAVSVAMLRFITNSAVQAYIAYVVLIPVEQHG